MQWKPRSITIHVNASIPSTLRVRQLDFPGFPALLGKTELDIRRDQDTGQIAFDIPAGEGTITLNLTKLPHELGGIALSIFSAILLLLLCLIDIRQAQKTIISAPIK